MREQIHFETEKLMGDEWLAQNPDCPQLDEDMLRKLAVSGSKKTGPIWVMKRGDKRIFVRLTEFPGNRLMFCQSRLLHPSMHTDETIHNHEEQASTAGDK